MSRNPNWSRDELILALDLYISEGRKQLEKDDLKVIDLSHLLNELPIHSKELRESKFRNPTGVSMKLANFLGLDPLYDGVGLSSGSKLDKIIWDEFENRPYELSLTAKSIRSEYKKISENKPLYESEDEEFAEGRILTRIHKQRERNPRLIKRKKDVILKKTGKLVCEVCGFDFAIVYGNDLGYGFAECHHLVPIAELSETTKTKLSDVAIVCANCHRMLHKAKNTLTIQELKHIIQENLEEE